MAPTKICLLDLEPGKQFQSWAMILEERIWHVQFRFNGTSPTRCFCVAMEFWTGLLPSILASFSLELYFFCGISKHQMLMWIEEGWSCRVASGLIARTRDSIGFEDNPAAGGKHWMAHRRRECLCSLRRYYLVFLSDGAHRGMFGSSAG